MKEMFYSFTQHILLFIYMVLDTIIVKDHLDNERKIDLMGYYFQLAATYLLQGPSHKQDSTYHSLYYWAQGKITQRVHHVGSV